MRIATLQFAPSLGAVEHNIEHANSLLDAAIEHGQLDLLVLPEMAFSGYNFPSLEAIKPFLEPTASGPTTQWAIATAKRLSCYVVVGYPEIWEGHDGATTNYNSTVTVSSNGDVVNNYRKSFLYYTDETWASEGLNPPSYATTIPGTVQSAQFFCGPLGDLNQGSNTGLGICMDINPYRFEAPWNAYEFANAMVKGKARLVILSMAWLARLAPEEFEVEPDQPDMETVAYWLERFYPFLARTPPTSTTVNGEVANDTRLPDDDPIIVVFANRCGVEGTRVGSMIVETGEEVEEGDKVYYAGSSCVMEFQGGRGRMYAKSNGDVAILGKRQEEVLTVDTEMPTKFLLGQK